MIWEFSTAWPYLCNLPTPNLSSFHSSNFSRQFSQVSVHRRALWRKYYFGMSKWYQFSTMLSYAQITILHKISAQSIHYFEPSFNIHIFVQCGTLQSKYHLGSSFDLKICEDILLSRWSSPAKTHAHWPCAFPVPLIKHLAAYSCLSVDRSPRENLML